MTLGRNGLNKIVSFMKAILKVDPIQIGLSKGLSIAQCWEGLYKKAYVGVGKRI